MEFFDDFTQLEPALTAASAQATMEGFLDLLGWKVAKAEKKCLPFSEVFVSLGVQVDLSQTKSGCVVLSHKPGRIDNLEDQVEELIASGKMNFKEALSIRGKVYFSESQVFGRMAAPVVHMLSRWQRETGSLFAHTLEPRVGTLAFQS